MKTFLRSLLLTIALLSSLFVLSAASLPRGVDGLRNYALASTTYGSLSVHATSLDYNWSENKSWVEATGKNAEEVLTKLLAQKLVYRLSNPDDKVESYIHLYDVSPRGNDATRQFYSYAEIPAADLADGKLFDYNIWMQSIPLLENVASAELLVLNPDRTTAQTRELKVRNGHVLLDPYLNAVSNAILVAHHNNGTTVSYDLGSSFPSEPFAPDSNGGTWSIQGHYILPANTTILEITEVHYRPTVYVPTSASHNELTFDIVGVLQEDGGTSLERPIGYYLTVDGDKESSLIPCPASAFVVSLPKGDVRMRFEWNKFAQPHDLYIDSDKGDGFGKGSTPAPVK